MKTEAILDQAALHCESHGRKLTAKRRQVLAGLVKSEKALSAYDLADYCREKLGTSLLPMSVYRMLNFFSPLGWCIASIQQISTSHARTSLVIMLQEIPQF